MSFFPKTSLNQTQTSVSLLPRCGICGLHPKCVSPRMEPVGKGTTPVLFVGDAPNEQEDKQGIPFLGEGGQLLKRIVKEIGYNAHDCWKTNSVVCHPPLNKMKPIYIEACRPILHRTIKKLKPKVIILLGRSALESLIAPEWGKNLGELSRWAGLIIPSPVAGCWVCPVWHPSYIIRSGEDPLMIRIWKDHLQNAFNALKKEFHYEPVEVLKRSVETTTSLKEGIMLLKHFKKQRGTIAVDFETNGLKPEKKGHKIVSCAFCFQGKMTIAMKIYEEQYPLLAEVLKQKRLKKVASNLKFEERWSRCILKTPVANWYWDTMLAAHCLDNREGITSIKFQAYIHLGVPDYSSSIQPYLTARLSNGFNRIMEANEKDLLLYNGMDALLEYMVMKKQRALFQ